MLSKNILKQAAVTAFATLGLIGSANAQGPQESLGKSCCTFDNAPFIGVDRTNQFVVAAHGYVTKNGYSLISQTQSSQDPYVEELKILSKEICASRETALAAINNHTQKPALRPATRADIDTFCSAPKVK